MGRACCPPRGFIVSLIGGLLPYFCVAQSLHMPPTSLLQSFQTETPPRFVETRALYTADTNVRPLLRKIQGTEFESAQGYLTGASVYETRLRWERWELRHAYGQADLFEGNTGAARMFLESEQKRLRPDTSYAVNATLNRSAVQCWTLTYHGEAQTPNAQLRYQVRLSYLNLKRVQLGWLQGQKTGDSFTGALTLLTTRGVPAPRIGGEGYTLGIGASVEIEGWSASLFVDNLWSQLRVRTLQRIDATVRVNQLTPDADGFLRAPPLLEGRVSETTLRRAARPRTELAIWRRETARCYGLIAPQDGQWRIALAGGWEARGGTLWIAYWQPHPMLWLGYETSRWRITLGADALQRNAARRLYAELSWRTPL